MYTENFSPDFTKGTSNLFSRETVHWEKIKQSDHLGNNGRWLWTEFQEIKHHCGTLLGRGLWKSGDWLSFISSLSHSGDTGSPSPFCDYPPVLELIIRIDTLSTSQSPHIGSLTCGMRASMVGKIKWKPLELLLLRKIVNQKQYWISGGTAEITATALPFNRPVWPVQKADFGEWQWIIVS